MLKKNDACMLKVTFFSPFVTTDAILHIKVDKLEVLPLFHASTNRRQKHNKGPDSNRHQQIAAKNYRSSEILTCLNSIKKQYLNSNVRKQLTQTSDY